MLGGISRCPQDGHSVSELLATADHAMYAVKAEGGGGFRPAWLPTVPVGSAGTPRGPADSEHGVVAALVLDLASNEARVVIE